MEMEIRQEVLNTFLAHLLAEAGVVALPERRLQKKLPDVYVQIGGLPAIIEAEVADRPNARENAFNKAQERLRNGLCYVALAVVYPEAWRLMTSLKEAKQTMGSQPLEFALLTRSDEPPDWRQGTYQDIANLLRQAPALLLREEEISKALEDLRDGVRLLSNAFLPYNIEQRLSLILGIAPEAADPHHSRQVTSIREIAALILMNALIFHEELTRYHPEVKTLSTCSNALSVQDELIEGWRRILEQINYYAVFQLAVEVLGTVPPDRSIETALREAISKARAIVRRRAILRHDLAGRIYHQLLGDIAKPLATFYTSLPAAVLLLRLALAPSKWDIDWTDPMAVGNLKVADFACGTGTLLMAALQTVIDNHLNSGGATPESRQRLLKNFLEEGLWGFDVLESAVHLTATSLALPIPEVMLKGMRLYVMPLGIVDKSVRLGSIDFLRDRPALPQLTLFPLEQEGRQITQMSATTTPVSVPALDLVCMNPPFTRTCGGNLLFGHLEEKTQKRLTDELEALLKAQQATATRTAGLGAVFITVADRYLKPGGRMAFVLPRALLSGVAWAPSRKLLQENYQLEYVIVSHHPDHWNFSESTALSEVLFVAQKTTATRPVLFINLWKNPTHVVDALLLSQSLLRLTPPQKDLAPFDIWVGSEKWGEGIAVFPTTWKNAPNWGIFTAFARATLVSNFFSLMFSQTFADHPIPLTLLNTLGVLGPDVRRLWATFEPVDNPPGYPCRWGHESTEVTTLRSFPNRFLTPKAVPAEPQSPDYPKRLWAQASRLLIAERLRLNTHRLTAVWLPEPVLATSWWPLKLKAEHIPPEQMELAEKALVLWLNSSLGLLLMIGNRQETMGAWTKYKKPNLSNMLVLDVRKLEVEKLRRLAERFDELADQVILPLPELSKDPVRAAIDEAIAEALGFSGQLLSDLRRELSQEPNLTLRALEQRRVASR